MDTPKAGSKAKCVKITGSVKRFRYFRVAESVSASTLSAK